MACAKGRTNPDSQTKLRLFSDSAGHCNRPECRRPLFSEEGQADYHIAEMAHILAANDGGPRAAPELADQIRASYSNLILLCANCHTMIDKCPDQFPDAMLREWKRHHKLLIHEAIGVQSASSREEALKFVEPLLRANHLIHHCYGPDNEYRHNPEAEEAGIWKRKVILQIIPNNQKLLAYLHKNIDLIHEEERKIVELFRQHVDDLVERHLGDNEGIASRFPQDMNTLFRSQ